jgi:hypothetical protein
VTASPLPTPKPTTDVIVRVVIVHSSSGTGWITLAVAIAGLVLSLASIGWQTFAFRRSGHRIRVKLRVGILRGDALGELIYKDYPSLELMGDMVKRGFSLVLIAIIRNDGRQAVAIEMCEWKTHKNSTAGTIAGDPLPKQLEAGASCRVAFDLDALLLMLSFSGVTPKRRSREISAVVHLGTGGRVQSKPLKIPVGANRVRYPVARGNTPSGVGWPADQPAAPQRET